MINVFSFQKIITQDSSETKNISKTLHHVLAQNQKKILSQSKASLDFRKILSRNHQARRNFSKQREDQKKIILNPLEETSPSVANIQSILYNKAFKIRCYSKRANKQLQRQNASEHEFSMTIVRSKKKIQLEKITKIKEAFSLKESQKQNFIRVQKYNCLKSFKQIASCVKIYYNKQMKMIESQNLDESFSKKLCLNQSNKIQIKKCSIVINVSQLALGIKMIAVKSPQKQKSYEFYIRRIIITLKKTIEAKFSLQKQTSLSISNLPQIIFKVSNYDEYSLMKTILAECEFYFFHCLFYIQHKFIQSTTIYDLSQINKLRSNIIIFDSLENFKNHPPFLFPNYNVAFCIISQKANLVTSFQKMLESSLFLSQIQNSFQKFIFTNKKYGQIVEFPFNKLLEKAKRKKIVSENQQREPRSKTESELINENNHIHFQQRSGNDQNVLNRFKEKMLMYLKIVQQNQKGEGKKAKHEIFANHQEFQCVIGREQSSKTNIQIISELIRLNNNIQRQIASYQKETQNLQIHSNENLSQENQPKTSHQMYVNILN